MVWVDCEMTGLDVETDTLLEIAVIITDKDCNILAEGPEIAIKTRESLLNKMNPWCKEHHGSSGLTQKCKESEIDLESAEAQVLNFVKLHVPESKVAPLAGNSIGQDAKFLSKYMPNLMNHLHYRVIDVSTVKELAKRWYEPSVLANAPKKKMSHRAVEDIKESIIELKYYKSTIFKQP